MDLHAGEIHLWCAFLPASDDERLLETYRGFLTKAERDQERRFHFRRDQHRYLVTRALVRTTLSRYVDVAPDEWRFVPDRYGRPEIVTPAVVNGMPAAERVSFNISHTDGLIILAVTRGRAVGVDTESVQARSPLLEIADRYFAPDEASELRALPPDRQQLRFFEYWTLKESYIKARGMGLSIPLDHFSFSFPNDEHIGLSIHPDEHDAPSRWNFWQLWFSPHFLAALCAERFGKAEPKLVVRSVIPLISERMLDYKLLRASPPEQLPGTGLTD